MKDDIFKKHYQTIGNFDAAVACANTTKEMMKGFAEWIGDNYIGSTSNKNWFKINYHDDATEFTTEQLLEKYLLTLNQ